MHSTDNIRLQTFGFEQDQINQYRVMEQEEVCLQFSVHLVFENIIPFYAPEGTLGGILKSHHLSVRRFVRPSVCPSVRPSVRPLQIVSQRLLIDFVLKQI